MYSVPASTLLESDRTSCPQTSLFWCGIQLSTMTVSYSQKVPNEPIFHRLVEQSKSNHNVIFHDPSNGISAKYPQLFYDILLLRQRLYGSLPASMFDEKGRIKEDTPYVFILSRGNYEFIVASFTVLAVGAALVPLGKFIGNLQPVAFLLKIAKMAKYVSSESTRCLARRSPAPSATVQIRLDTGKLAILAARYGHSTICRCPRPPTYHVLNPD